MLEVAPMASWARGGGRVVLGEKEIEADYPHTEGLREESCTAVGTTRSAYSKNRDPHDMCRREEEKRNP